MAAGQSAPVNVLKQHHSYVMSNLNMLHQYMELPFKISDRDIGTNSESLYYSILQYTGVIHKIVF